MARGSFAGNVGKGALGVGFGFALAYFLRLGGGFGLGGGRGEGRGEGAPSPPPAPGPPVPPAPPSLPKDDLPLLFWMFNPTGFKGLSKLPDPTSRAREDARFLQLDFGKDELSQDAFRARVSARLRSVPDYKSSPAMSIDDVIARIKAGGRDDVRLMTSGATVSGSYDDVKDALMAAGIKHWELWEEAPADRKPGEPAKAPHWNLFDKGKAADLNPDKKGHYHFENVGTAYWNLSRNGKPPPTVSGSVRKTSSFGRGYYR